MLNAQIIVNKNRRGMSWIERLFGTEFDLAPVIFCFNLLLLLFYLRAKILAKSDLFKQARFERAV